MPMDVPVGFPGAIGFIGAGSLGSALAVALSGVGYPVRAVNSRSLASAQRMAGRLQGCRVFPSAQGVADTCDLVFLTTPDDAIASVAASVKWRPGQGVVHCSGAQTLDALAPARAYGSMLGSLHPLQTFAGGEGPEVFQGIAFAVEADPPLRPILEGIAKALGGWPIAIAPQDRPLYHISAVTVCGFLATLVALGADLWGRFSAPSDRAIALKALLPLAKATVTSLERQGIPGALTGPFVRGDVGTIMGHLEALARSAPHFRHLYCHLGIAQLPLAQVKGCLTGVQRSRIQRILESALGTSEGPGG